MRSVGHYLSEHFPELHHPAYQTTVEKIGFVAVTAMIVLPLVATLVFIVLDF